MNRKFKSVFSVIICVALLSTVFGCAASKVKIGTIDASVEPVYPQSADASIHSCATENLTEVDTSGLITLLFDESSSAICVRVANSENSKLWSALPQAAESAAGDSEAKIVSLEVVHNDKIYHLNSQDNSFAVGGTYTEKTGNDFVVTYLITENGDWLKNIDLGATDETYRNAAKGHILFKVTAKYSLKDGCFYATLNWANLGDKNDTLINVGFLEYFGANNNAAEGDYILVPDGSGAIIDTASDEKVEPVNIAVYGNDIGGTSELTSVVAAYGMKSGSDAYAAVIETGDAMASIVANKSENGKGYNRVGPKFAVSLSETDVENNEYRYTEQIGYDTVSVCLRFLSGANATYAGIAAACREQLIRNFTLSTRSVEVTDYMPLLVNIVGKASTGGFFSANKELTDYTHALDILGRLKSKGIDNVYLRYSGALTGGLNSVNAADASDVDSLGGKSGITELNKYASGLNFSVFYDIDLISDKSSSSSLKNLSGKSHFAIQNNPFSEMGFKVKENKRYFIGVSSIEKTVLSVLERFDALDATGYCLTDVGVYAFTELNSALNRQDVITAISEKMVPLSTESLVMVRGGNFYALKNADVISELPMTCSRTSSDSYKAVPFVQIILHGIVEFSYDGINMSENEKLSVLRCVEYGAIPGYVVTNNSLDDSEEYADVFSVDERLNFMYDSYSSAGEVLNDLRGSRITDHYMVSENVYCTEYESTTRIYVNYSDEPVTVSGITVDPMSYFRVN